MANNIVRATQTNTAALPKLAIVPVQLQGGADQRVADTLAQLLATNIIRSGAYEVYPRTQSLEQVMREHNIQLSGVTADENIIGIGRGDNPGMVLSVVARNLGPVNMFNAVIINLLTGAQVRGRSVEYRNINDGMRAMEMVAATLTGTGRQRSQRQQQIKRAQDAKYRLNTVGIAAGTAFATPGFIGTVYGTYSPFDYLYGELGFDVGLGYTGDFEVDRYYSLSPFVTIGAFVPFRNKGGWYAGIGCGYMFSRYTRFNTAANTHVVALNVTTGFNIADFLNIAYTLRTNFSGASNKLSVGYVYRFK